jgi:hypothetical protein
VFQIKRIHEYKRQLMNVLSIIQRYKELKAMKPEERKKVVPRVCMFGGKAASGGVVCGGGGARTGMSQGLAWKGWQRKGGAVDACACWGRGIIKAVCVVREMDVKEQGGKRQRGGVVGASCVGA